MPLDKQDWGEAFRLFDVDDAGFIDARKLFNVIRLLGYNPTEAEVQDLIAAGDKDGNGEIDYEEFKSIVSNNLLTTDDDVMETFCVFDRDESGYIGIEEISLMFSRFGHDLRYEYIQAVTEAADVDGDGIISFKDFVEVFNQRPDSTYVVPPEPETAAHSDDNDEEEAEAEADEEDEMGGSRSHVSADRDSSI